MRDLLLEALELSQAERYRLAFLIAESLGYTLRKETEDDRAYFILCGRIVFCPDFCLRRRFGAAMSSTLIIVASLVVGGLIALAWFGSKLDGWR